MPDIFDEVEAPAKGDIFDEVAEPKPVPSTSESSLLQQLAGTAKLSPKERQESLEAFQASPIPETHLQGETALGKLGAGTVNVASRLARGVVSPMGAFLAPLGMAGAIPRAAMGVGFGAPLAYQGLKKVYKGAALGESQEVIEGAEETLAGGLMASGGAKEVIQKAAPILPQAAKAAAQAIGEQRVRPVPEQQPALKTKDGLVVTDVSAQSHDDLVDRYNVPQTEVAQRGHIEDGNFIAEQPKTTEVPSASEVSKTAEVHGDVRPHEEPAQAVPEQVSSTGVQPPTQEVPQEGQARVLLSPEEQEFQNQLKENERRTKEIGDQLESQKGGQLTGMGGALAEGEILQGTALKNAVGDMERVGLDLAEAYPTVRHDMAKAWVKGGEIAAKDPTAGRKLADDLITNPERGMTDDDSALLLRHKVDVFNAMNDAAERTHVGDKASRAAAEAEHSKLSEHYLQLLDAIRFRGSQWGREGRWRQALAKEDYDFESVDSANRYHRARTGRDLTPEQREQAEQKVTPVKEAGNAENVASQKMTEHIRSKRTVPDAEKAALDAAWKTVREAAARMAEGENKTRVENVVRDLETAGVQKGASSKALTDSVNVLRDRAIKLADADNASRVAETAGKKKVSDVQVKASQKALDAAADTVRKAAVAAAKEAQKRQADPSIAVWEKANEYLDKGIDSFDDIRHKIATDLGMDVKKVTRLLLNDKRAKTLADDLWKKQQASRQLKQEARRWLTNLEVPKYQKALQSIPRILFGLKVGFHGTVAMGTHAPFVAFQPRFWKTYVQDFGKMYKMVADPAYYEMQRQDLVRRKNYITARRGGLVNDPHQFEDFNSPDTAKYFGKLSGMGNRGYTVLKILRQDMFDQMWDKLPKTAQIPEISEAISDGLNHATGVVKGRAPRGTSTLLFAPRLEASRAAWLAVDPARAGKTFLDWKNATPGEKAFAINQVKEKAWVAGTLFSMLALNQGFLSATKSDQNINFDDPFRSDWLKFKAAGMNISYGNAMITMARLPVQMYRIRDRDSGKLRNLIHPDEDTYSLLGKYVRSQLSPFAGLMAALWTKADYANRPLPSSNAPVPKRLRAQGIEPYTWPEFWSEQLAPIPAQEAMKEVWRTGMGMSPDQVKQMMKAMSTIAVMGATGARLTDDTESQ